MDMTNSVKLPTVFIIFQVIPYIITDMVKCDYDGTFEDYCKSTIKGTAINGRCFFISSKTTVFDDAFDNCKQENDAVLAQIHTKAEYEAVNKYIPTDNQDLYPYIALQRMDDEGLEDPRITLNGTFWFNSMESFTSELRAGNTWIRTHKDDGGSTPGENCFTIFSWDQNLNDVFCTESRPGLCQITDGRQKYQLISGMCVTDGVISKVDGKTAQECLDLCVHDRSCRSFNIEGSSCQLVSWSIDDSPNTKTSTECRHYKQIQ